MKWFEWWCKIPLKEMKKIRTPDWEQLEQRAKNSIIEKAYLEAHKPAEYLFG